jgi:uncharacterized protein involved in type VI secretion and phage assembly
MTRERVYGKHRGRVSDDQDPSKLGRIRAQVPEVLGTVDSGWALPAAPYGGDQVGLFTVPPVGAGVWIEFEAGDVSRPIWSGCWWADGQPPPDPAGKAGEPATNLLRTEKGLTLALNDDALKITITDEQGKNLVDIDAQGGTVTVTAASKIVLDASQVEIAKSASHPVVLGDQLQQYLSQLVSMLQSHVHPTSAPGAPTGPPVPPLPTPPPGLNSNAVKTG